MQYINNRLISNKTEYMTIDSKILQIMTFNVCQKQPSQDFYDIICKNDEQQCDIIIFVFQELDKLLVGSNDTLFK